MAEIETTDDEKEFVRGFWARTSKTVSIVAEHYIAAQSEIWIEGFLSGTDQPPTEPTSFLVARPDDWD